MPETKKDPATTKISSPNDSSASIQKTSKVQKLQKLLGLRPKSF